MKTAIKVDRVTKRYRMGLGTSGLRSVLGNWRKREPVRYHWAVNDVSFELQSGESLGIVGPNGAGKTTILKLLSGVTRPTSGEIRVNGRFSALIELGAGFHPDLTGRENIFLNGAILGMKREEIRSRFDRIVDFSGIEQFLDTPVKRYSSGMYARLGFAIAAHIDPDVLLVDEVLAVGDYAFRMKCYERMDQLRANGTSLIFVSHNMEDVRRVCHRGLIMFRGQKVYDGSAVEAVAQYPKVLRQNASPNEREFKPGSEGLSQRRMTHAAKIERVELVGDDGKPRNVIHSGERVYVLVEVQFHEDAVSPVFAVTFRGSNGEVVYDTTTRLLGITTPSYRANERALIRFKLDAHLLDGAYTMAADLAYADLSCYYDFVGDALNFVVVGADHAKGVANLAAEVTFHEPAFSQQGTMEEVAGETKTYAS